MFFFFNDTATTEIYTLSLHDALPIWWRYRPVITCGRGAGAPGSRRRPRSEEHTSELQSQSNLVCRLLLEKKKNSLEPYSILYPHPNNLLTVMTCHPTSQSTSDTLLTF